MSNIVMDLAQVSRCGAYYRSRKLEELNITIRQARLLLEVCATPDISQDALSRRLCMEKSAVTRSLAGLEDLGYVERVNCQKDKRVTRVHPTAKAQELKPKLDALWDSCQQQLTEGMTEEELAVLAQMLGRMKAQAMKLMEVDK